MGARQWGYCAAHGAWLTPAAGNLWLAAGDAALAFDLLAAQGLFNAMYLGLAAAEATHRHLAGDQTALTDYGAEVSAIRQAYRTRHAAWYQLETRWPISPSGTAATAPPARRMRQARSWCVQSGNPLECLTARSAEIGQSGTRAFQPPSAARAEGSIEQVQQRENHPDDPRMKEILSE